uniref:Methyltransferase FkbM domain-containing protein n=1 Tax=Panagrolaimus sp. ES5 TaxID=591445 RepID=A0AC34FU73_9BILA
MAEDCTSDLVSTLSIQKLRNLDEFKYIIFPKVLDSDCNTVTLGIGKDVVAEKQLLHKLGHCNFFGVDPDAEDSGQLYKDTVNGTFVQGLVGAKNGTYKATVLNGRKYVTRILPHFSFDELMLKHYRKNFIDYFFMDIEGNEFDLMKELISTHKQFLKLYFNYKI